MADYKTVASAEELDPGEAILVNYGRIPVLVFNIENNLYAIEDRCSHADVALSDGQIDLSACQITCPKHGASFDIKTGEALSPPAVVPLMTFDVRVHEGQIQVARLKKTS